MLWLGLIFGVVFGCGLTILIILVSLTRDFPYGLLSRILAESAAQKQQHGKT